MVDAWGGSWGNPSTWGISWGATADAGGGGGEGGAGGAGSGGQRAQARIGGRQFPFPNRYDDPNIFLDLPPKVPEEIPHYIDGDPVEEVEEVEAGEVNTLTPPVFLPSLPFPKRRPPAKAPDTEADTRQRVEKVAREAKKRKTPKYKPPPEREPIPDPVPEPRQRIELDLPPLTEAEEKEEELLILRMLEIL